MSKVGHGGKREGAGRKRKVPEGATRRRKMLTDNENARVDKYIEWMRRDEGVRIVVDDPIGWMMERMEERAKGCLLAHFADQVKKDGGKP